MNIKKPLILEYLDLAQYLRDIYQYRKASESDFSYEKWAGEMGLRSRAYLRSLIIGERPLHESLLPCLIEGLSLDGAELEYLTLLLRYHTTGDTELKKIYSRQMMPIWRKKIRAIEISDSSDFLLNPLTPVLFTYLSFDNVASDLESIRRDLNCESSALQEALRVLVWQKLVDAEVGSDGGIYYKTIEPYFTVPSKNGSQYLKNFHVQGIKQSQVAAELPAQMRKLYSVFLALDEEQFKEAHDMILDFNRKLLQFFASNQGTGKKIYRMNLQVVPVSEKISENPVAKNKDIA